ncbi:hypothetical protein Tsubulata_050358 [Turnera subulata]|uniref:Uncharacterized protein n=1 Tax=Turnera subulata TaxID=218843 RepID=A0A9Q0FF03_9ROSI|nr:hypothetical protein Tsubulata_050358 [Turnera subulata]
MLIVTLPMNLMLILLKARFLKPNFMSDVRFQVQSSFRFRFSAWCYHYYMSQGSQIWLAM